MKTFTLPDLGEGLKEAEIVSWHVGEGDHVVADQPLVAVETEKAVVEVPSPQAGRILKLFAKPGDRVGVGASLVAFEENGHADTGTVVGELATSASSSVAVPAETPVEHPSRASDAVRAAPAARRLARERGLDISRVRPTGPDGTVTREDVIAAAAEEGEPGESGDALQGVRRAMALNMARAHAAVVPATVFDEAEIARWWSPGGDVTPRLVRAIAAGVAASPVLNAWYDGAAMRLRRREVIDLGLAVDSENGLIVPVLRDVARQPAAELRQAIDRLKAQVRDRTVPLSDLRGATITLSNFGVLAGRHAVLVVVPPQVAILGAGRIRQNAFSEGGAAVFRPVLPLSLTFDHRAVTGGEAARFLAGAMEDLKRPD
jgi:2-oxoisovalerate dehydrogenase E2 component (dihydrolipoyl transacylase)